MLVSSAIRNEAVGQQGVCRRAAFVRGCATCGAVLLRVSGDADKYRERSAASGPAVLSIEQLSRVECRVDSGSFFWLGSGSMGWGGKWRRERAESSLLAPLRRFRDPVSIESQTAGGTLAVSVAQDWLPCGKDEEMDVSRAA